MTTYARGVSKTVSIQLEQTSGTPATPGAGLAQSLRRTSSDLSLNVQQVTSQEILTSQQVRDQRNGPSQVQGTISGQLSPTTYNLLLQGVLRNAFTAITGVSGDTGTAFSVSSGSQVLTSATAAWTSKFKIGDIVRCAGAGVPAGLVGDNLRITNLTATVLTALPATGGAVTGSSGSAVNVTYPGKKLYIPASSQADYSFTIEHWFNDIGLSETFFGCKVSGVTINIPATGFCTIQASVTGLGGNTGASQVYAGANLNAPSGTTGLVATTGKIAYNGVPLAYITGMNVQITSQTDAPPVAGSNVIPQIFLGTLAVRGSITCLTTTDTLTADFLAENEVQLSISLTTDPSDGADFISLFMPRVKLVSSTKTDSDRQITRSFNFVALENTGGAAGTLKQLSDFTSIMVQDSLS